MINTSWEGVLLIVLGSLFLFGAILAMINIDNPLAGSETSVIEYIFDLIGEAIF